MTYSINKNSIKRCIYKIQLREYYNLNNNCNNNNCNNYVCFSNKSNKLYQGYVNTMQTNADKISYRLKHNLGGKIMYGNKGVSYNINYLGGIEGQSGGMQLPLRNKFN